MREGQARKSGESGPSVDEAPATMETLRARVDELVGQMGRLDGLSERLRSLVERDEAEGALEILREREQVLAEVTTLSGWIERQWARVPASKRERELGTKLGAVEQMASRIAARDRQDISRLEHAAGRVADELAELAKAGRAERAYGTARVAPATGPKFQDREA